MMKGYNQLLNTDCVVVRIDQVSVYPIFRVGSTSLMAAADQKYTNREIAKCRNIHVLLRNPEQRFISGLNEYCRQKNLDVAGTWTMVQQGKLIDRHFAPQYMWLMHLYRYYKGTVTLKPFEHIKEITDVHEREFKLKKKIQVKPLKHFIEVDYLLMRRLHQSIELGQLIEEHRNALS